MADSADKWLFLTKAPPAYESTNQTRLCFTAQPFNMLFWSTTFGCAQTYGRAYLHLAQGGGTESVHVRVTVTDGYQSIYYSVFFLFIVNGWRMVCLKCGFLTKIYCWAVYWKENTTSNHHRIEEWNPSAQDVYSSIQRALITFVRWTQPGGKEKNDSNYI